MKIFQRIISSERDFAGDANSNFLKIRCWLKTGLTDANDYKNQPTCANHGTKYDLLGNLILCGWIMRPAACFCAL